MQGHERRGARAGHPLCGALAANLFASTFRTQFEFKVEPACRDTSAEVRALVIRSVGGWVVEDARNFLNDSYLKYLGWALSDKV